MCILTAVKSVKFYPIFYSFISSSSVVCNIDSELNNVYENAVDLQR